MIDSTQIYSNDSLLLWRVFSVESRLTSHDEKGLNIKLHGEERENENEPPGTRVKQFFFFFILGTLDEKLKSF